MVQEKLEAEFVVVARGGKQIRPYIKRVKLSTDMPNWAEWAEVEGETPDDFDHWCNWELNLIADGLEEHGASVIVFALAEYLNLHDYEE